VSRPKAVIYTRVSTDEQSEKGTSLETQRQSCLKRAGELGASVVECLSDEGISGATLAGRPSILRALALIEEGSANVLLCYDLSRLSRSVEHQAIIKRRVEAAGGRLAFVMGTYSDDAEGDLFYHIDGGFKQYERSVIRRRTMGGRKARAEQGQQPSRARSPYGLHVVTKADVLRGTHAPDLLGKYVILPEEAAIVKAIFNRYANGATLRSIEKWLNSTEYKPQFGDLWYQSTIRNIILNPAYAGQPAFGRTKSKTDEGRIDKGLCARFHRPTSPEEQIRLTCEPLVNRELWDLCQDRLAENRERASGPTRTKRLLAGMFRCPQCKKAMKASRNHGHTYYHCRAAWPSRTVDGKVCLKTSYRTDQVETLMLATLLYLAHRPDRFADALRVATQKQAQQKNSSGDLKRLRTDLAKLDRQEEAAAKAQVDAIMDGRSAEVYDRLLSEIDTKRRGVKAQIADLEPQPQIDTRSNYTTESERIAEVLRRFEEVLSASELSDVERNGILSRFIKAVWPTEDGYMIDLRLPSHALQSVHSISMNIRTCSAMLGPCTPLALVMNRLRAASSGVILLSRPALQ
jgi:site-specific DNA recombinase